MKKIDPTEYKYTPKGLIHLSDNTVALIQIFKHKNNEFIDHVLKADSEGGMQHSYDLHKESAREFVRQLQDEWCVLFMEGLVKATLEEVQRKEFGDLYKNMLEHIMDCHKEEVARITKKKEEKKSKEIDDSIVPPAKLI